MTSPLNDNKSWYKQKKPQVAPTNWEAIYKQKSLMFIWPVSKKAKDTEGFKWAPEIPPNPEARPTIKNTKIKGPATGESFNTAAPHPT